MRGWLEAIGYAVGLVLLAAVAVLGIFAVCALGTVVAAHILRWGGVS